MNEETHPYRFLSMLEPRHDDDRADAYMSVECKLDGSKDEPLDPKRELEVLVAISTVLDNLPAFREVAEYGGGEPDLEVRHEGLIH